MNDFISPYEDVPLKHPKCNRTSDFLDLILSDGSIICGFYCVDEEEFYSISKSKCVKIKFDDVKGWRSQ